jgi:hypothetical protein
MLAACALTIAAQASNDKRSSALASAVERTHYQIDAEINFDDRTYIATERVRWTNISDRSTSALFFNLYMNLRSDAVEETGKERSKVDVAKEDVANEPHLEILEVRLKTDGREGGVLPFSLEGRGALLRVNLRAPIAKGNHAEIEIKFRGRVPEIDADETGLLAHVVQGVDAALRDARETQRARDFNFRSRGVMLLGAWYPVLAVRGEGGVWQREAELNLGRMMFAEAANYEVNITTVAGVGVFAPGNAQTPALKGTKGDRAESNRVYNFSGKDLRDFAILLGRGLDVAEVVTDGVSVRSIYLPEHERTGRRVLEIAREATAIYARRFGQLPYNQLTVIGAPLVAGRGSLEFAGMSVIASAFYVDFDTPSARNLPEIVREQRGSLEDSLEWTVAHGVAHQWWGAGAVGNDPKRSPVLDEGLAQWAALIYYRVRHGEERAAQALEDQLRGVYTVYRTFGGEDREADRPAGYYRNSFQYAAIISSKGALLFEALRKQLGDERMNAAVQGYYTARLLKIAEEEDLRLSFARQATNVDERRIIARTFNRWLSERRGDEDIAPPNPQLANALGIPQPAGNGTIEDGKKEGASANPLRPNTYARIGRFFWKQMTRIR